MLATSIAITVPIPLEDKVQDLHLGIWRPGFALLSLFAKNLSVPCVYQEVANH